MLISLSKEGCQQNNVDIGEALLLLSIYNKVDLETTQEKLIKKGYITADRNDLS